MHQGHEDGGMSPEMIHRHYWMLGLNLIVSLVIMYFVMFTMIWSASDFFNNLNMAYMAVMMAAPMGILMLLMMGMMYPHRGLNVVLYTVLALLFVLAFWAMRAQAAVGDRQFLRSMIPHHSGAVLMCERAQVRDPEIKALCSNIVSSQRAEIDQMKRILQVLEQRA